MTVASGQLRGQETLGEIVVRSIALYRQHFVTFLAISLVGLPFRAATLLPYFKPPYAHSFSLVGGIAFLVSISVALFLEGAVARAVADIGDGSSLSVLRIFRRVLGRFVTLLATAVQTAVAAFVVALTIVGIPLAVYLVVRWTFFPQVIAIDNLSVDRDGWTLGDPFSFEPMWHRILTSFSRHAPPAARLSAKAVDGKWWHTFGSLIFFVVLVAVISVVPTNIVSSVVSRPVGSSVGLVIGTIMVPFYGIALTLLFFDLQGRQREPLSVA